MTSPTSLPASPGDAPACRLLYLAPQLDIGGYERQLMYLLQGLDRAQHRPCVVVWNFDRSHRYVQRVRELSVPLIALPVGRHPAVKLRALRAIVRRAKPEVVHSYSYYTNIAVAYACWLTPALPVGSIRCDFHYERTHVGPVIGRLSARWPRQHVCNSWTAAQNVARARGPFAPRQVEVVTNGVDLDELRPSPLLRRPFLSVVGMGTLCKRKNWACLLPLAERWARDGTKIRLRIAGDGPLRRELDADIRSRGLEGRVELVGELDDVRSFLANADVLVHVSEAEGTPNVVLEAMAAGRAVVALQSGDMGRLVEDGVTGYVVPPDRLDLLDERLRALASSPMLLDEMGRAARKEAEHSFGLDTLAERTLEAYARLGWPRLPPG